MPYSIPHTYQAVLLSASTSPHILLAPMLVSASFQTAAVLVHFCLLPSKLVAFPRIHLQAPANAHASHLGLSIQQTGILQCPRRNCKEVSGDNVRAGRSNRYTQACTVQARQLPFPTVLIHHHSPVSHCSALHKGVLRTRLLLLRDSR